MKDDSIIFYAMHCEKCDFAFMSFFFHCPNCQSGNVKLMTQEELEEYCNKYLKKYLNL